MRSLMAMSGGEEWGLGAQRGNAVELLSAGAGGARAPDSIATDQTRDSRLSGRSHQRGNVTVSTVVVLKQDPDGARTQTPTLTFPARTGSDSLMPKLAWHTGFLQFVTGMRQPLNRTQSGTLEKGLHADPQPCSTCDGWPCRLCDGIRCARLARRTRMTEAGK